MIRREVLEEYSIRFSSGLALGEDGLFIQIVCQYIDTIAFVPDVLYYYRSAQGFSNNAVGAAERRSVYGTYESVSGNA